MSPNTLATDPQPDLSEQFDDLEQQRHADHLGMWVFLSTEIILFGGLFTGYTAFRWSYPDEWRAASEHLYVGIGALNTAVLLTSSLFMALAVHAAQTGHRLGIVKYIALTLLFGLAFLGLKGYEYHLDISDGLLPWVGTSLKGPHPNIQNLFLVFYWVMTGLHAVHMVVGITVLAIVGIVAWRGRFSVHYHSPVEVAGLYWHFVDIVWVFLLPTLYLVHPHKHLL